MVKNLFWESTDVPTRWRICFVIEVASSMTCVNIKKLSDVYMTFKKTACLKIDM